MTTTSSSAERAEFVPFGIGQNRPSLVAPHDDCAVTNQGVNVSEHVEMDPVLAEPRFGHAVEPNRGAGLIDRVNGDARVRGRILETLVAKCYHVRLGVRTDLISEYLRPPMG